MQWVGLAIAAALGAAASPVVAQQTAQAPIVTGDAAAGLMSRRTLGEVHVVADPALADGRLVLRIVVLNRGKAPAPFGPDDVSVATADGTQIVLMSRAALLAEQGGDPRSAATGETTQAHAAPSLPVNGAGQTDVSGFSGGMGTTVAGVPQGAIDRSRRADPKTVAAVAALDAVLLKPIMLKPGAADGGQIVTTKLKRGKTVSVTVTVMFAGEEHRFDVAVPKR
jgi:hypothetical protein